MKHLCMVLSESDDHHPYFELRSVKRVKAKSLGTVNLEIPGEHSKPVFIALIKGDETFATLISDLLQAAFWAGIDHENKRVQELPDLETEMNRCGD